MPIVAARPLLLLAVAATFAATGMPAAAQNKPATPAKKVYCWGEGAQRTCSDTLPQEAVNAAREEFNSASGLRSGEVARAQTAEERADAAAQAAQAQAEKAAEDTRRRTEQALLASFQSEAELRRVFTQRVDIAENNVQTARYNLTSLREGLASLLRTAGDRELAGQQVPEKLATDIQQRHRELLAQQRLLGLFQTQRAQLDTEIEQTVERYRALKAVAAATP